MDVSALIWIVTVGVIIAMLAIDFVGHVKTPHAPTLKEAATWSAAYVVIALLFGLFVLWQWGGQFASEYYAGYITEKALSVDNLFVFVLIMTSFAVPRIYQQKVLLIGIIIALGLRTVFIFLGKAVVENFAWVFYLFGAFLIYTAIVQIRSANKEEEFHENKVLKFVRRIFPTTENYVDDKLTVKRDGRRFITPMLIVMIAIGSTDLLFAVDSIPAIFGLTQEVYLIFAANAFSLLGLRQLYFLIDGLLDRLVYLNYGLAAILGWIGIKQVIHALHVNELSFINGGQPVLSWEVPTSISLGFIVVVLAITTVTSLRSGRSKSVPDEVEANPEAGPDPK